MSKDSKGMNVLISVLVALLAVMVPLTVLKACGAQDERRAEVEERIQLIKKEMVALPPGGRLEVLASDLRAAEKELEELR